MNDRDRSATTTCLSLPEIVSQVGSYLFEPKDLFNGSCVNRLWYVALLSTRSQYPHVTIEHLSSFLSFLKSNPRAAHHCRALRILCEHFDDEPEIELDSDRFADSGDDADMDSDEGESATEGTRNDRLNTQEVDVGFVQNAVVKIMDHLADHAKLRFFMYALPGEPSLTLPDEVWLALRKMSDTLQGLYVELIVRHWPIFLQSRFSDLTYLRLFLDTDEPLPADRSDGIFDPKVALLSFLQSHQRLEVLHLYLGMCFANLDLASVRLPSLRSFLLISKAENVNIVPFIVGHPGITSLDAYTDTEVPVFPADSLPNVQVLQVSALTISWFADVLKNAAQRKKPIQHLQITVARQQNFQDVLQRVAPLGSALRCLELIFWSRNVPLLSVLEDVNRTFPRLVEFSMFIPSWGDAEWEEEDKPVELASMLQCFAQNRDLLAFAVSDPKAELLTEEQVETLPDPCIPPNLRYVVWRAQTFRLDQRIIEGSDDIWDTKLKTERTYHPRNFRGSRYLRDWHEEMVFDHLAGDYEVQLRPY